MVVGCQEGGLGPCRSPRTLFRRLHPAPKWEMRGLRRSRWGAQGPEDRTWLRGRAPRRLMREGGSQPSAVRGTQAHSTQQRTRGSFTRASVHSLPRPHLPGSRRSCLDERRAGARQDLGAHGEAFLGDLAGTTQLVRGRGRVSAAASLSGAIALPVCLHTGRQSFHTVRMPCRPPRREALVHPPGLVGD